MSDDIAKFNGPEWSPWIDREAVEKYDDGVCEFSTKCPIPFAKNGQYLLDQGDAPQSAYLAGEAGGTDADDYSWLVIRRYKYLLSAAPADWSPYLTLSPTLRV